LENPYWQYFCGLEYFAHTWPCDASQLTRWRQRLKGAGAGELLAELLRCGLQLKQLKAQQLASVIVDTTVQTKAVRFPTDARLYERSLQHLAKLAKRNGVKLRRSYLRALPREMRKLSGYRAASAGGEGNQGLARQIRSGVAGVGTQGRDRA
jgi:IS5 family transposase